VVAKTITPGMATAKIRRIRPRALSSTPVVMSNGPRPSSRVPERSAANSTMVTRTPVAAISSGQARRASTR
jgi:hypothetical protein